MARPKTKSELIDTSNANFEKLWQEIDTLTEKALHTTFDFSDNPKLTEVHWQRDKNIRDVLIHLYEWHQLLINWINKNQANEYAHFLPEPYNWKTYAEMNVIFWQKHQKTTDKQAKEMLKSSHCEVIALVSSLSNEALFTKKYFSWTGTTHLGSYCISSTSSHYDWAIKKLKKHKRNTKQS